MAENWVSVKENQAAKQILFEDSEHTANIIKVPGPCQDDWCYGDINTESCLEFFTLLTYQTHNYFGYKKKSTRFWFSKAANRNILHCTGKD